MIDFDALVLKPAMTAFAGPVTIAPIKSLPGAPPYLARGSFASKPVEIALEGSGDFHRTQDLTLGIRLSEFAVAPRQGDTMMRATGIPLSSGTLPDGTFEIYDLELDGQGGAMLTLRKVVD